MTNFFCCPSFKPNSHACKYTYIRFYREIVLIVNSWESFCSHTSKHFQYAHSWIKAVFVVRLKSFKCFWTWFFGLPCCFFNYQTYATSFQTTSDYFFFSFFKSLRVTNIPKFNFFDNSKIVLRVYSGRNVFEEFSMSMSHTRILFHKKNNEWTVILLWGLLKKLRKIFFCYFAAFASKIDLLKWQTGILFAIAQCNHVILCQCVRKKVRHFFTVKGFAEFSFCGWSTGKMQFTEFIFCDSIVFFCRI